MFVKCVEVQDLEKRFYNISFEIVHSDFILQTTHKFPESFCRNNDRRVRLFICLFIVKIYKESFYIVCTVFS